MYLFTAGEDVDVASLPAILQTKEMQEAISVLQHFSENERQYLIYQQRLEAEYLNATWHNAIARAKQGELAAWKQAERAKQQAERERQENERLLALLKQAGIDPNASL